MSSELTRESSKKQTSRRNPVTHEAILKAALELLSEASYQSVSIEAIAKRSGTGKATIYRWWKHKTELFVELYLREAQNFVRLTSTGDIKQDLTERIKINFRFWRETPCGQALRGIISQSQEDKTVFRYFQSNFITMYRSGIEKLVSSIYKEKSGVITDCVIGFCWYHLLTNDLENEEVISDFVDTILK